MTRKESKYQTKKGYVVNLGDTRAILCDSNFKATRLSVDHKATDENEINRLTKFGAVV
jgi:serine/threonine protein phosphatase PrpC